MLYYFAAGVHETLVSDMKTLDQHKESFDCIKEVSELDNTDAIVRKFLAQEAENFALFNYVTELNGANESLAEEVNQTEKAIAKTREQQAAENKAHTEEFSLLEVINKLIKLRLSL